MDWPTVRDETHRHAAVGGTRHLVDGDFEEATDDVAHGFLVIEYEDMPAGNGLWLQDLPGFELRSFLAAHGIEQAWQIDAHASSPARLGVDGQIALMATHDAEDHGQSQARPLSHGLGGEEGVEGLVEDLRSHTGTLIDHIQHHVVSGWHILREGRLATHENFVAEAQTYRGV